MKKKTDIEMIVGEDIPEVEETVLDEELASKERKRPGHPSHKGYNRLTVEEEKSVTQRFKANGKERKSKRYDGRALKANRPRTDVIMKTFYEEVDLPEFKEALQYSKDPKFLMLYQAISTPSLHKCSFAELCRRCGLGIRDISDIYRDHQKHRGLMRAFAHIPKVLEDTAIDAQTRVVVCSECNGRGKVGADKSKNRQKLGVCPVCHGDGKRRLIGDKDSRQLIFETAGLKKGGSVQAVQVNVGGEVPHMEDVIAEVEDAIDIKAEQVSEEEENVRNGDAEGFEQAGEGSEEAEEGGGGPDEPEIVH